MRLNQVNRLFAVILVLLILGTLCVVTSQAWGSCRIVNISLKKQGDFTKVSVYGDKPFEFSHFTEEAKAGKPYRIVIDCQDAIFDLPQRTFEAGLPPGTISRIRTSQFQAVPEKIVRIVLDLKAAVVYKVTGKESENEASIAILTTQDPDFPMWVAVLEEETLVSGDKSLSDSEGPEKEKAETFEGRRSRRKAVSRADTGETDQSARTKTKSERGVVKQKESKKTETESVVSKPSPKKTVTSEEQGTTASSVERQIRSSSDQQRTKRVKKVHSQSDDQSTTLGRPTSKPQAQSELAKKKTPSGSSSPERQISRSPEPMGPFPKSYYSKTKTEETQAEEKQAGLEQVPDLVEKGIGRILGPESATAKETQALADSEMVIHGSPGTELGLTPQRKMIYYNPGTRRDPFLPITDKGEMSFGDIPLPLFESLKLVGVLKDEEGNRALLEDKLGFGYIMMSGDRIKDGYLISVDNEKAFFHVEEYGGYQIMVLELNEEY